MKGTEEATTKPVGDRKLLTYRFWRTISLHFVGIIIHIGVVCRAVVILMRHRRAKTLKLAWFCHWSLPRCYVRYLTYLSFIDHELVTRTRFSWGQYFQIKILRDKPCREVIERCVVHGRGKVKHILKLFTAFNYFHLWRLKNNK